MGYTLIVDNVDAELLYKQRQTLINMSMSTRIELSREELDAVDGLINMLDGFADEHDGYTTN